MKTTVDYLDNEIVQELLHTTNELNKVTKVYACTMRSDNKQLDGLEFFIETTTPSVKFDSMQAFGEPKSKYFTGYGTAFDNMEDLVLHLTKQA